MNLPVHKKVYLAKIYISVHDFQLSLKNIARMLTFFSDFYVFQPA